MKQSIDLTDAQIGFALKLLGSALNDRLKEKGRDSFVNAHEILGATEVEVAELREAVHQKIPVNVIAELLDVAVGCVVGISSLHAHEMANSKGAPK